LAERVKENEFRLVMEYGKNEPRFFANQAIAKQAVSDAGGTVIGGIKAAEAKAIQNALRGYKSQRYSIGGNTYQLDNKGMVHILEGHHPSYFNGEYQKVQSFLGRKTSVGDIKSLVGKILEQNKEAIGKIGSGQGSVQGVVDGVRYQVTIDGGRIVQFFPIP